MSATSVLVIDDDPALRGLLTLSLASDGYTCFEAGSFVQATDVLKNNTMISIIVLDMGMPPHEHEVVEGLKVLDWISEKGLMVNTLVLTGQDSEEASYLAIRHGAFDFLSKPIEFSELLAAVRRAELFLKQTLRMRSEEGVQKMALDIQVGEGVKQVRNAAELKLLRQVLNETEFNIHETGRRLGLKRENVYYLMNKYGLERVADE